MVLGLGGHSISASDLPNLDTARRCSILSDQFFQGGSNAGACLILIGAAICHHGAFRELHDVVERNGILGRVDNRFKLCFQAHKKLSPVIADAGLAGHHRLKVFMFAQKNLAEQPVLFQLDCLQAHKLEKRQKHANQRLP